MADYTKIPNGKDVFIRMIIEENAALRQQCSELKEEVDLTTDRYQEFLEELAKCRAVNAQLVEALRRINEAAAYDIQYGDEGPNTDDIEAISRAALARAKGEQ